MSTRHILAWSLLATVAASVAVLALLPSGAPLAADTGDASGSTGAQSPGTDFGGAVPNDKFIQSFQQQVTQQLQSALAQSNDSQEQRLHSYEEEQRELRSELQSLQQMVGDRAPSGSLASGAPAGMDSPEQEPPHVNVRRPSSAEDSNQAATWDQTAPPAGFAGSLLDGLVGQDPGHGNAGNHQAAGTSNDDGHGTQANPAQSPARIRDHNVSPHGFVEGRLLNGVVAVVGGPDRESIVAIDGPYQSANGFLVDLDGCFALVQGKPEIAAGRIDFKLSRLTCNFADGGSRTWDAAGWLVDSDGIRGLRALIVENAGRKALAAAASGAVGGVGQRLSQQQYQITALASGLGPGTAGTSSTFIGSTGIDALGGAASGAANAMGQSINDYYNLYSPSLQVGGGTPVTVVLANDLRLPPSGREISPTHTAAP